MKRMLIVEDEENNLVLISRLARSAGFEITEARTGEKAIAMAVAEKPDVILLDIGLPDISGTEVLKAIRSSEANGDIPIVAMTSYAMSGDRERLLEMGCNGYIEKPYEPSTVIEQILQILDAAS